MNDEIRKAVENRQGLSVAEGMADVPKLQITHDIVRLEDDWILYDESDRTPRCPECGRRMDYTGGWESVSDLPLSDDYQCPDADCHTWISYSFDGKRQITASVEVTEDELSKFVRNQ